MTLPIGNGLAKDFILYFPHKHTAATHPMMVTPSDGSKVHGYIFTKSSLWVFPSCHWGYPNTNIRSPAEEGWWLCNYWSSFKAGLPNKPPHLAVQQKVAHGPGWEGGCQATPLLAPMQEPHTVKAGRQHIFGPNLDFQL